MTIQKIAKEADYQNIYLIFGKLEIVVVCVSACSAFALSLLLAKMDRLPGTLKEVESKFGIELKEFRQTVYVKIFTGKDVFLCAPASSVKTFCFIFLSDLRRCINQDPLSTIILPLSSLMADQATHCCVGELQTDQFLKDMVSNVKFQ